MNALCQLLADWKGEVAPGGMLAQQKMDGFRCLWIHGVDGVSRLFSRNGIPLKGCEHIARRCEAMEKEAGERLFLDCELVVDGTLAATKSWCERGWRDGGERGVAHMFDCLAFSEWRAGGSTRPYHERHAWLEQLVSATAPIPAGAYEGATPACWEWPQGSKGRIEPDPVSVLPVRWVFDADDALEYAREVWAENGEGVVIKDAESPYVRKRSPAWQKIKQENHAKWYRAEWGRIAA